MLDDINRINSVDKDGALKVAAEMGEGMNGDYSSFIADINGPVDNICFVGMGGSAIAIGILQSLDLINAPIVIVKNYHLPKFVGDKTLLILSSYSGTTDEVLNACEEAKNTEAKIVCIGSGGRLEELAQENSWPFIQLPETSQPRLSLLSQLTAQIQLLQKCGLVGQIDLASAVQVWRDRAAQIAPEVPTEENTAKTAALNIAGTNPIIYSSAANFGAAYFIKACMNENAKSTCWINFYPEANHNEYIGWTQQPQSKPFSVIDLRSAADTLEINTRFEVTARTLSGVRPAPINISSPQTDRLLAAIDLLCQGVFTSIYLAIAYGSNPTPVDKVESFKQLLRAELAGKDQD